MEICEVTFDTKVFGVKTGSIDFSDAGLSPAQEEELIQSATEQGYGIMYLASHTPLKTSRFQQVGSLEIWEGSIGNLLSKTERAVQRIQSSLTEEIDWIQIEKLLSYSSDTRFTNDTWFSPQTVKQHKVELVKTLYSRFPQGLLCAEQMREGLSKELIGYHLGLPQDGLWMLYELLVHPSVRTGVLALALVGTVLRRGLREQPSLQGARSKIYADNKKSKDFFRYLGLEPTGEETHYYHLHLDHHCGHQPMAALK